MNTRLAPSLQSHLSSAVTRDALLVQAIVLEALRTRLRQLEFTECLPPILGPVTDPGARGSKQVDVDFYGNRFKLMSSIILYKQAVLLCLPRVFFVAQNVRMEPPHAAETGRHLAEFTQFDVEVAGAQFTDAMDVLEDLVIHAITAVLAEVPRALDALGRDRAALARIKRPFPRMTHAAARERLAELGAPNEDIELRWDGEALLSSALTQPTFVTHYPRGSRGFYDKVDPSDPARLLDFDLILPDGFGEVASGGEREYEVHKVVPRIRETGEDPGKYAWFVDIIRAGIPPSAGFGLGVERLTRFLTGLAHVAEVRAFPKLPGIPSP